MVRDNDVLWCVKKARRELRCETEPALDGTADGSYLLLFFDDHLTNCGFHRTLPSLFGCARDLHRALCDTGWKDYPASKNLENPIVFDDSWDHSQHEDSKNQYTSVTPSGSSGTGDERVDSLFRALDGLVLVSGREKWTLSIMGIHGAGDDKWIQILLDGPTSEDLVIHLKPRANVEAAVAAIRAWVAAPSRSERLLSVG